MVRLSVNVNKIATLRNSRGGDVPNVLQVSLDAEAYGAQGITVHPRPDQRHIRYQDVRDLKAAISTELNVEGYPTDDFIELVCEVEPAQVTLVPDAPDALTSNAGWDTVTHKEFLTKVVAIFKAKGIRVSIFVDADIDMVKGAKATGADRIELYTEPYADGYEAGDKEQAIKPFIEAAIVAEEYGLGVNAGHDLNLENLHYFASSIPELDEVSIGHALIADTIYLGLENTIDLYRRSLDV